MKREHFQCDNIFEILVTAGVIFPPSSKTYPSNDILREGPAGPENKGPEAIVSQQYKVWALCRRGQQETCQFLVPRRVITSALCRNGIPLN